MVIDQQAFIEQVEQHKGKVWNLLRSHIQDQEVRKDLFQDVLMEAWRSYPKFRQQASFGTWIYRIALNVIFLSYRKASRQVQFDRLDERLSIGIQQEEVLSPQAEKLLWMIRQMKAVDRSIISAHLDGYSNQEVADIIGMNKNQIAVRLYRIKETLKSQFKKVDHGIK